MVHGKGSLRGKMAGDDWQRFANLRALYAWMWAMPGAPLLFMGAELGRNRVERDRRAALVPARPGRAPGVRDLLAELNGVAVPSGRRCGSATGADGFQWLDADDAEHSIYAFLRWGHAGASVVAAWPTSRPCRGRATGVGLPYPGSWKTLLDTNAKWFWGTGYGGVAGVETEPVAWHGYGDSAVITLPPLAVVWFSGEARPEEAPAEPPTGR